MGALQTVKDRVGSWAVKALAPYAPGSGFTPPPFWPVGWWQMGYRAPMQGPNSTVESCVAAISQTVASLPLQLWRNTSAGGLELVTSGDVVKVLRRPNRYQTRADFILNLLRSELFTGNGYAIAERQRGKIVALHGMPGSYGRAMIAQDGSVFYAFQNHSKLMPEPSVEDLFPSEDVLHIRMQTPRHPLIGESPLTAAAMSIAAGDAIIGHMASFFSNMTRPSGYLKSPKILKPDVAEALRSKWQESYSRENSGQISVLMDGLEWQGMSITSTDAQLIQSYKMTSEDIARVFRIPLAVVGVPGGATFSSTETLIRFWMSTGLGYVLEHLELAIDNLFDLQDGQFVAFDQDALLRSDFAARVDALTKGITGGLYSPNEARSKEGLGAKEFGDEPRLQAQVVPLSFAANGGGSALPSSPSNPSAPSNPAAPQITDDSAKDPDAEEVPEEAEDPEEKAARQRALFLEALRRTADAA